MPLTEQEAGELWRKPENYGKPLAYAKAIEIAVIEKIKAQGQAAKPVQADAVESLQEILQRELLAPRIFIGGRGFDFSRTNTRKSK